MGMVPLLTEGTYCRKQRPHFIVILDAGGVFDAAGNVYQFGVELLANCGGVFGRNPACKPEGNVACFFE